MAHDGTIITEGVDEVWGTDVTQTVTTGEGRAYVFVAVDHCSGETVGIHAARSASRFEAPEPVRQGVATHFGAIAGGVAHGLSLRHDHGSNYMADDSSRRSASSASRAPPPSCGNGVAERTIRTVKENLLWVHGFATLEALRQGLLDFAALYNARWLRERHGYKTPDQIRAEQRRLETAAGRKHQMAA